MPNTETPNLNSPAMPNLRTSSLFLIILLIAAPRLFLLVDCRPLRPGSTIEPHRVHNNVPALASQTPETAVSPPIYSGSRRIGDDNGGVAFTFASGPSRKGAGH
ncbi:unnamed protein product [Citrullus colocynthis]|uniref:Uncharacterized protein n=1 Tax=Citrullus colocynthis TaxID=252529 RepID=A0ABP0YMZ7_9ROSI